MRWAKEVNREREGMWWAKEVKRERTLWAKEYVVDERGKACSRKLSILVHTCFI